MSSELDGTRAKKAALIGHVIATHSIDPARAVMIGDRSYDITGAHANAMRAIGVLWGYAGEGELDRAGADAIIAAPGEILPTVRRLLQSSSER